MREALRRNKGREEDQLAVVVADMKRRSPTSAELPPDINAFDDPAAWASQVIDSSDESVDTGAWLNRLIPRCDVLRTSFIRKAPSTT